MARLLTIAGFALGLFALLLQLWLTIPARMAAGHGLIEAIVFYFSFFTILSNIAAVGVYAGALFPGKVKLFDRLNSATPRATIAVCITIVGLVYATVLAKIWAPEGLFWLCDVLLHYAAPVIFVVWWLLIGRSGTLRFADAIKFLPAPILYLIYALVRGAFTGTYPYPFLDVTALGSTSVAVNCLGVALLFFLFSLLAVLLDRNLPAPKNI
jgi:hypothetical protein